MSKTLFGLCVLALIGSGTAQAQNSLTVTAGGANGTGNKLEVLCDGSSNNVFVQSDQPTDESHYLVRFWVNPGLLALQANRSVRIGGVGGDVGQHLLLFLKRNDADNSYRLNTWYNTDVAGFAAGPGVFLVLQSNQNQWRQVEVEFTAGAGTGQIRVQRIAPTASTPQVISGLDNDLRDVDNFRWGGIAGSCALVAGGSGAYYLDEFESLR